MRSLQYRPPGGIEKLIYSNDLPEPDPSQLKSGEVIIKVAAAGLIYMQLFWRMPPPKDGSNPPFVLCPDYAGTIHAVGPGVTEFSVGDEVMATSVEFDPTTGHRKYLGGAAEYVVNHTDVVMKKPRNITLRDAASIPLCAFTAWQAFHEQAAREIKSGVKVLIAGAGGATGLWAVQVAKLLGAHVTVTASDPPSIQILKDLGADEIVNYREQNIEDDGRQFDFVLDVVGGKVFDQCKQVVKKASDGGQLISLTEYEAATAVADDIDAKFFIWRTEKTHMAEMVALIEEGRLKPFVDSYFPISDGTAAYTHAAKGHCHGKVILEI